MSELLLGARRSGIARNIRHMASSGWHRVYEAGYSSVLMMTTKPGWQVQTQIFGKEQQAIEASLHDDGVSGRSGARSLAKVGERVAIRLQI